MVWHYYVNAERGALEYLIIEFSYKEAVWAELYLSLHGLIVGLVYMFGFEDK